MDKAFTTDELENWFAAIISSMRERGIERVEFDHPLYHCLDSSDVWETGTEPPEASLGDVHEDLADLRKDSSVSASERGYYLWHTIDHLRGPLTLLSAKFKLEPVGKI